MQIIDKIFFYIIAYLLLLYMLQPKWGVANSVGFDLFFYHGDTEERRKAFKESLRLRDSLARAFPSPKWLCCVIYYKARL